MKDFAKIFTSPETGQVVVMADTDDEDEGNPAIKLYFQPLGDSFGVCVYVLVLKYEDPDEGYDKRDYGFEKIDESTAIEMVKKQLVFMAT